MGCQDQVITAYGGLNRIDFWGDASFRVAPIMIPWERLNELQSHLMLFFTGLSRTASEIAAAQIERDARPGCASSGVIHQMVDEAIAILRDGRRPRRLRLAARRGLAAQAEPHRPHLDAGDRRHLRDARGGPGASAGKLIGAGGGGFMLLFAPPEAQPAVRAALARAARGAVPLRVRRQPRDLLRPARRAPCPSRDRRAAMTAAPRAASPGPDHGDRRLRRQLPRRAHRRAPPGGRGPRHRALAQHHPGQPRRRPRRASPSTRPTSPTSARRFAALREAAPDGVFHLAVPRQRARVVRHAQRRARATTSSARARSSRRSALAGLDPMIQLCSTSEVYGQVDPRHVPIDEDAPLRPASPYAVSKTAQDLLGWTYFASYKHADHPHAHVLVPEPAASRPVRHVVRAAGRARGAGAAGRDAPRQPRLGADADRRARRHARVLGGDARPASRARRTTSAGTRR